jgi:hypothetical protein
VRRLLGLAAVFVLAGCGATSQRAGSGAPIVADASAPPIEAVDEAPSADQLDFLQMDWQQPDQSSSDSSSGFTDLCTVGGPTGITPMPATTDATTCPPPTPEEQAQAKADEQRYDDAIRPGPDTPPRVLAKLSLSRGGTEYFILWRTANGSLCWDTDEESDDGGGGGGPVGPCTTDALTPEATDQLAKYGPKCDALCLESDGGSNGDGPDLYVLAGTVPATADAIRVTQAGGATATYPRVGPTIAGSDRRVFLLDLGTHDWRKLELVRGSSVVETEAMPPFEAASEDCSDRVGPLPQPADDADEQAMLDALRAYSNAIEECVRASGVTFP